MYIGHCYPSAATLCWVTYSSPSGFRVEAAHGLGARPGSSSIMARRGAYLYPQIPATADKRLSKVANSWRGKVAEVQDSPVDNGGPVHELLSPHHVPRPKTRL